ncbi:MAG: hypothetical protein NW201_13065 [Gemmatimonadales bacterium]|nr:hypothetical protein [Gemmatimonadales bacterium]
MTATVAQADFFALEAGEILDRLGRLLEGGGAPEASRFVLLARALRGSALLARQQPLVAPAGALEAVARAVQAGSRPWDAATKEVTAQAVDTLRGLVRRTTEGWGASDDARAAALATALERLGALPLPVPGADRAGAGGLRQFVAREGALVATALEDASRALAQDGAAGAAALYPVLRRMQPIRGLAGLTAFEPLPEILEAIELMAADLARGHAPPPELPRIVAAAARVVTRIARDVSAHGAVTPDAAEELAFGRLVTDGFAAERDVVGIDALLVPPGQVQSAGGPRPGTPPDATELVSHGEHLASVAETLLRPRALARDLRLYAAVAAIRSLGIRGDAPVTHGFRRLAAALRERIADGSASAQPQWVAVVLRGAGATLRRAAEPGITAEVLAFGLWKAAEQLFGTPPWADLPLVDIADLLVVEAPAPVAAPAVEEPPPEDLSRPAIERSFRTLAWLQQHEPAPTVALATLLAPPARRRRPTTAEQRAVPEAPAAEVAALQFRGRAALERAAVVRAQLLAELAAGADLAAVRPRLDELLDLIPLALDAG